MIYFAQIVSTGAIKIGYSDDVESRMKALESSYRQPLALLHTIEGDRKAEHKIHERFAHLRFGRTEQFRPGLDLMEFIGLPVLVSANPDAVVVVEPPRDEIAVKIVGGSVLSDDLDLGPCCCCGGTKRVRNIIMLPRLAPVAGQGWGCFVCGLPMDGALYVACDACARTSAQPYEIVVGLPSEQVRAPIASLSAVPFEHRSEYHEGK